MNDLKEYSDNMRVLFRLLNLVNNESTYGTPERVIAKLMVSGGKIYRRIYDE